MREGNPAHQHAIIVSQRNRVGKLLPWAAADQLRPANA